MIERGCRLFCSDLKRTTRFEISLSLHFASPLGPQIFLPVFFTYFAVCVFLSVIFSLPLWRKWCRFSYGKRHLCSALFIINKPPSSVLISKLLISGNDFQVRAFTAGYSNPRLNFVSGTSPVLSLEVKLDVLWKLLKKKERRVKKKFLSFDLTATKPLGKQCFPWSLKSTCRSPSSWGRSHYSCYAIKTSAKPFFLKTRKIVWG